jgi:LCP family protein required for cell wall assembly
MSAPVPAPPRLHRTWPQRLLIATCAVLIAGCLTGAGGIGYAWMQFGRLDRVDIDASSKQEAGDPENFLLVGSDSRGFVESEQDRQSFGQVGGQRSDTVMLVRVDPRAKHAWMLSFPRDLWLPIAPDGHEQRINTAYEAGNPQRLIDTIKANFNVPVHHYAEVDFKGFQSLVDTVGGVKLYVAGPIRDRQTGLDIASTGCVLFHRDQAL